VAELRGLGVRQPRVALLGVVLVVDGARDRVARPLPAPRPLVGEPAARRPGGGAGHARGGGCPGGPPGPAWAMSCASDLGTTS
jgi:hypothetical protein